MKGKLLFCSMIFPFVAFPLFPFIFSCSFLIVVFRRSGNIYRNCVAAFSDAIQIFRPFLVVFLGFSISCLYYLLFVFRFSSFSWFIFLFSLFARRHWSLYLFGKQRKSVVSEKKKQFHFVIGPKQQVTHFRARQTDSTVIPCFI